MTTSDDALMDVCVVQIAVDASARPEIQKAMDRIASSGDTSSPAGLLSMLVEAIALLRVHGGAWSHAGVSNASPMSPERAESVFAHAAHTARTRFEHEVVRNFDGELVREPAPELPATDEPGRVVVTFVVAAHRSITDADERNRAGIEAVLDDLVALGADDFVALEVVWSPADQNDRMSLEAMGERYPALFELHA